MHPRLVCAFSFVVLLAIVVPAFAADEKIDVPKYASGMYISVRDVYMGKDVFPTPIEGLRKLKVDAIDIVLGRDFSVVAVDNGKKVILKTDEDAKKFRERTEKLGVRICCVETACDFSAGEKEANVGFIVRSIELADLLGAPAVRVDSAMAKEKELSFEERVNIFAEGLGGALRKTEKSKVTLGIENHGFQGNNLAFLLNVFQLVSSPRLGSTLDTGNFYWRGYPLSEVYGILRVLAPYAKHTHVKNIKYPQDQRELMREAGWEYNKYVAPLEEGDIDIAKVVNILKGAGYKGDICIEDESLGKFKAGPERAAVLERDVNHIRKILESTK
jgi:sugar phosphate isomerase/epimerase